jgi:hypothetical protein
MDWPSYPAIYFFVAHGGVLVACSFLTFGRVAELRRGAVWRAFGILAAYAAVIGAFNAIFGANYMYYAGNRSMRLCLTGSVPGPGTYVAAQRWSCCSSGRFGCPFGRLQGSPELVIKNRGG